jgi:hypothetical protein
MSIPKTNNIYFNINALIQYGHAFKDALDQVFRIAGCLQHAFVDIGDQRRWILGSSERSCRQTPLVANRKEFVALDETLECDQTRDRTLGKRALK